MKYFNSAYMKFTVKDYTKWQALEIGIMMACVIFPLLFVLVMELILRGAANTSKGVMKSELFLLPELLWTTLPFSSRPKSLPIVIRFFRKWVYIPILETYSSQNLYWLKNSKLGKYAFTWWWRTQPTRSFGRRIQK